jgi:CRP-like cAMP-binding protein
MEQNLDLLLTYGASSKKYDKGEILYSEGSMPHFYFQIIEGSVKVYCMNSEGKEMIQGIFKSGESFGEPPLFVNKPYPTSAMTLSASIILRLTQDKYLKLIDEYPSIAKNLLFSFATRIYNKAITTQILNSHTPEEKIILFLDQYKQDYHADSVNKVPFTRQQIAELTGLRVETVIRTLSKLNKMNKVKIIDHKVYY